MLIIIIAISLILQVTVLRRTEEPELKRFMYYSIFFSIFFYGVIEFQVHQYIRMMFGGIKLMGYITLAAVFLPYFYTAMKVLDLQNKVIFILIMMLWVFKLLVEYGSWFKVITPSDPQMVEDLLLYSGLLIWMILFLKLLLKDNPGRNEVEGRR